MSMDECYPLNAFSEQMRLLLTDTLTILCFNPARIYRKLMKIIPDWDVLQYEAEQLDLMLSTQAKIKNEEQILYLGHMVCLQKMELLEMIMVLGFHLELYLTKEMPAVYRSALHLRI